MVLTYLHQLDPEDLPLKILYIPLIPTTSWYPIVVPKKIPSSKRRSNRQVGSRVLGRHGHSGTSDATGKSPLYGWVVINYFDWAMFNSFLLVYQSVLWLYNEYPHIF